MGGVASAVGGLFGGSGDKPQGYDADKGAFTKGYGKEQKQIQGELDRAKNIQAPTSQAAQLGKTTGALAQNATGATVAGPMMINGPGAAPQANAAQLDQSQANQMRSAQSGLVGQLQQQANGQGPSLATSQMNAGMAANRAAQMSQAASQRGFGNTAGAMRQAAYQTGAQNQTTAIASGQARIQEQLAARQQLAGVASDARGQDLNAASSNAQMQQQTNLANQAMQGQNQEMGMKAQMANQNAMQAKQLADAGYSQQAGLQNAQLGTQNSQFNANLGQQANITQAQMQQQTNMANQTAKLQSMGMSNDQIKAMLGMNMTASMQTNKEAQDYQTLMANQNIQMQQLQQNKSQTDTGAGMGMLGGLAGAAVQLAPLAMSDEREKIMDGKATKSDFNQFIADRQKTRKDAIAGAGDSFTKNIGNTGSELMKAAASKSLPQIDLTRPTTSGSVPSLAPGLIMSDEDEKNMEADRHEVKQFLDKIQAHKYTYKHPDSFGEDDKVHYSPTAQELEKSKIGKSMVVDDDETGRKMVDYGRGFGALMAATANLNERIKKIEKGRK
jgi:hypothetical protein